MTTKIEKITYRGSKHFALPRKMRVILSDGRDLPSSHVMFQNITWLTRFLEWTDSQVDAAGDSLGARKLACDPDAGYSDHAWEFEARALKLAVLADPSTVAATVAPSPKPSPRPTKTRYTSKQRDTAWANRDQDTDEVADGLVERP